MQWNFLLAVWNAIPVAALVLLVLWLARNVIIGRLTASVKHEFDAKLAQVNSALRQREEEMSVLRENVLNARAKRIEATFNRRLDSVERIVDAVTKLSLIKGTCELVSVLKTDALAEELAKNQQAQEQFRKLVPANITQIADDVRGVEKAKPYVSPLTWAYYSAYQNLIWHAVAELKMATEGLQPSKFMKGNLVPVLMKAMPNYSDYLEKNGVSGAYQLAQPLEDLLYAELKRAVEADGDDAADLEKARAISHQIAQLGDQTMRVGIPERMMQVVATPPPVGS